MNGEADWITGELLGFDFETTGVDRFNDVPVSYALVTVRHGVVVDRRAGLVDPGREIPAGAMEIHGITTERARAEGIALDQAAEVVADALLDAAERGVPVVGMKLDYDLTMLDVQCQHYLGGSLAELGWRGPVLDGLVLDRHVDQYRRGRRTLVDLCAHYGVTIEHAHDAAADAEAAVQVVLAIGRRYPDLGELSLGDLRTFQKVWHRQWAKSYDEWRRSQDMLPLDARDLQWPIPVTTPPTPLELGQLRFGF